MEALKLIFPLLFLSIFLASCTTPGNYMGTVDVKRSLSTESGLLHPEFIPITPSLLANIRFQYRYEVGWGDILNIIIWNHPELMVPDARALYEKPDSFVTDKIATTQPPGILVDEQGEIFFPLAGKIRVASLTVDQIRASVTKHLLKYIRNPQVSVRVESFRNKPMFVLGEVMKPGIQYITDIPLSILESINHAGGINKDYSDPSHIYVIRGNFIKPKVYWLNASSPRAMLMAESFQLKPFDVVYVSTADISRWNRIVSQLLPTVQATWYARN
jgi:polysaccharide biosynthesis/export protein